MIRGWFNALVLVSCLFFLLGPSAGLAADKEVKASTNISGLVPSEVSTTETQTTISVSEVLADSSQSATLDIVLKKSDGTVLSGVNVCAYSNRGAIDKITAVDSSGSPISRAWWGIQQAYAATQTINGATCTACQTGKDGRAYLKVTSDVPGTATIVVVADNYVKVGEFKLTFLPLPFPKNVSFSLQLPKSIGKIIPGYSEKTGEVTVINPQSQALNAGRTVNLGADIQIPFWLTLLVLFLILLTPFMIHAVYLDLGRIRKSQRETKQMIAAQTEEIKKEEAILAKEEQEIEKIAEK